jgi:hypothetical protein
MQLPICPVTFEDTFSIFALTFEAKPYRVYQYLLSLDACEVNGEASKKSNRKLCMYFSKGIEYHILCIIFINNSIHREEGTIF